MLQEGKKEGWMDHSKHTRDTLGATDLSRDGISHLKTQNIPKVKPHKPSRWMCKSGKKTQAWWGDCQKHQNLHELLLYGSFLVGYMMKMLYKREFPSPNSAEEGKISFTMPGSAVHLCGEPFKFKGRRGFFALQHRRLAVWLRRDG